MLYLELWNTLTPKNWSWSWERAELVGSSCALGRWSCEHPPTLRPLLLDRISIMLTAMLQLCSGFRRWNISQTQRLLSTSILAPFFAPQLLRRRSIKPTSNGRDRTPIHYRSHPHKRWQASTQSHTWEHTLLWQRHTPIKLTLNLSVKIYNSSTEINVWLARLCVGLKLHQDCLKRVTQSAV